MGKKRPAAGDRGDAPKRLKESTQQNGGPQRENNTRKKADVNGKKQKTVLVIVRYDVIDYSTNYCYSCSVHAPIGTLPSFQTYPR
jgi:hypothetical protein